MIEKVTKLPARVDCDEFKRVRMEVTTGSWKGSKGWITGPLNPVGAHPVTLDCGTALAWFPDEIRLIGEEFTAETEPQAKRYWYCLIGPVDEAKLPLSSGADLAPRLAVRQAVLDQAGCDPDCRSGWISSEAYERIKKAL